MLELVTGRVLYNIKKCFYDFFGRGPWLVMFFLPDEIDLVPVPVILYPDDYWFAFTCDEDVMFIVHCDFILGED